MNETTPRHAAEAALLQALDRVATLNAERVANPILGGALARLGDWQSRRLSRTYADLASDARYADAIRFFETDLYGSTDFTRRDAEAARVAPLLVRMLPEGVIATIAQAVELNALSQELDRVLLGRLPRADARFTVAEYCRAFRRSGNIPARRQQIRSIVEIGRALDHYVRRPALRAMLALMRGPARIAGLGALHEFLERGFDAFHRTGGADAFLATIEQRETALLDAIMAGANDPFPDPLGREPPPAPQSPPA